MRLCRIAVEGEVECIDCIACSALIINARAIGGIAPQSYSKNHEPSVELACLNSVLLKRRHEPWVELACLSSVLSE